MQYISERFKLGGIRLAGSQNRAPVARGSVNQLVWSQIKPVLVHFSNNPLFERGNTDRAVADIKVPTISRELVARLLDYATAADWQA